MTPIERAAGLRDAAVSLAPGTKCARCWKMANDPNRWPEYPELCARCADAVLFLRTGLGLRETAMKRFDETFRNAVAAGKSKDEAARDAGLWTEAGRP